MKEEGVIKFNCHWIKSTPLTGTWINDLTVWRDKLYKSGLIGVNEDGIGYGNISIRFQQNKFIISKLRNGSPIFIEKKDSTTNKEARAENW